MRECRTEYTGVKTAIFIFTTENTEKKLNLHDLCVVSGKLKLSMIIMKGRCHGK